MDEHSESTEGPTPAGGAYAVAYFRDDQGEPTTRAKATRIEIVEFDDQDEVIMRTYGRIDGTEPEPE